MKSKKYYVGLDIGTSSVGYAVTDEDYNLLKHNGEPMWGSHIFDPGETAAQRRSHRIARRRNDRKKQRVALLSEIFAPEIAKVDERFFIRRQESALYREDVHENDKYIVFNDKDFTDRDYYEKYPTIHHLICELIQNPEPHDVRLVYMACAYLVAHRGHFLSEVDKNNIDQLVDFTEIYNHLLQVMSSEYEILTWKCEMEDFKNILKKSIAPSKKEEEFKKLLNIKKAKKEDVLSLAHVIKLLSGLKVSKLSQMFPASENMGNEGLSFRETKEDAFEEILVKYEEHSELLRTLRLIYDWALLDDLLQGKEFISVAKKAIYEEHGRDLRYLKKKFVPKYCPKKYFEIFRKSPENSKEQLNNYVAYSYNLKNTRYPENVKKTDKIGFCDYIKSIVENIAVDEEDRDDYEKMMLRLETYKFCPKQVEGDNRVIPYQLYYHELEKILDNAEKYLPFLGETDEDGYVNKDKILSIMEFRVPYYVGPLRKDNSSFAWVERKAEGKIYPWNFTDKVNLDQSEENFIEKMTNTCSYLPGEKVLPKSSLMYQKFMVLNEINNIRVNGELLSVADKQLLFEEFKKKKMTVKKVEEFLRGNNILRAGDVWSGIDQDSEKKLPQLESYRDFKRLLESGKIDEKKAELIIERITYSQDKNRLKEWLKKAFKESLDDENIDYLSKKKYEDFGRLSAKFLTGITVSRNGAEEWSILDRLMETNENLMQILSMEEAYSKKIQEYREDYYRKNTRTLDELLKERYLSNSVKRSIYRALDILKDIRKATGTTPEKIFIEMARGDGEKGERKSSRRTQIEKLYKNLTEKEVRDFSINLSGLKHDLDDIEDNKLQRLPLFLYFLQLGKSAYTGNPIDINDITSGKFNKDHIWPQKLVKDDSFDNLVLVESTINESEKKEEYPLSVKIQNRMGEYWKMLYDKGLMSKEKYSRLMRKTEFSPDEKMNFINRQLVFTRQATKALAEILQVLYPESEIIYCKAANVRDFRHEILKTAKCRSVNDLHHAKDAYLNIVVGNVYHCRFTKNFNIDEYSIKPTTIFFSHVKDEDKVVWSGSASIEKIGKVMKKNSIHYTSYSYYRKSKKPRGLFDQNPLKAGENLFPRKKGMDTKKYGGYDNLTAAGFLLVKYNYQGKKKWENEVSVVAINMVEANKVFADELYALEYCRSALSKSYGISSNSIVDLSFPLGFRFIKVNAIFSFDGFRASILGKNDKQLGFTTRMPLIVGAEWESYIKRLDSWAQKKDRDKNLTLDEHFDKISKEENLKLYDVLVSKITDGIYSIPFSSMGKKLVDKRTTFEQLDTEDQVVALRRVVSLLQTNRSDGVDLSIIGESKGSGTYKESIHLSHWKKKRGRKELQDIRLIDVSPSGIFESSSENLLDYLE